MLKSKCKREVRDSLSNIKTYKFSLIEEMPTEYKIFSYRKLRDRCKYILKLRV